MFNTVDVIGADSICKLIRQTKLSKFIIFRGGSQRGSTPVFRCEDSRTPDQAIGAFKDWAESVLRMNPYNNLPYDLFLFSQKVDSKTIDAAIKRRKNKEDDEDEDDLEDTRSRKDRIRFTFALNPFNNMQAPGSAPAITADAIGAAVESALKKRDEENYVRSLEAKVRELENDDDDDEEEEEEEEKTNALDKVYRVIKEINRNTLIKKGKYAEAAGDDDEDEDDLDDDDDDDDDEDEEDLDEAGGDDDDEDEEEKKPDPKKDEKRKKKLERMKKALKILAKADPHIDTDLMILAKIAQSKPKMFNNYMTALRNMNL